MDRYLRVVLGIMSLIVFPMQLSADNAVSSENQELIRTNERADSRQDDVKHREQTLYGELLAIDDAGLKVSEFLDIPCYYPFDHMSEGLTREQENEKYNSKNLPWCNDPSGGTLYKFTNKTVSVKFGPKTTFIVLGDESPVHAVSREKFVAVMKQEEAYRKLHIIMRGDTAQKIEQMYED